MLDMVNRTRVEGGGYSKHDILLVVYSKVVLLCAYRAVDPLQSFI